ncbi:hypothetical protein Z517_06827 [Fonsecaea pedrosoi CBS 271.37]|uniref:Enoyl reductase (ER) domain-containing protein n=1 Tax=Fonsecaea pedrosoi CBS 271.37 TaxID=1442368 RepID=A0A0D2F0N5_9EURO|nr:uncharacterized protein Z517_06827 [Fonsecaea pedrosoi CBS 271.37]KIW80212.1 hypothetical protein Z517_06827 [Fonsecaea pedrosoi CBS 271.37]
MTSQGQDSAVEVVIPSTMKAAVCKEAAATCVVENIPVPKPTGRHLLVKVKAASLCQTDLTVMSGNVGTHWFPLIPGHEAVSVVVQVPEEATPWGFQVGDLVGAPLWCDFCLDCWSCKTDQYEYCVNLKAKGVHAPGYFSEYTTVDAASAVLISRKFGVDTPLQGSDRRLSPIFCAGITVWDGLVQAKLAFTDSVGVIGVGGLGQVATAYLTSLGHKVIAMDVEEKQLTACTEYYPGIETIDISKHPDLPARVKELNGGNLLNAVFVTSGAKAAYDSALPLLAPYGKMIVLGLPLKPVEISAHMMSDNRLSVVGARVPNAASAAKCLEFCQRLSIYPRVHHRNFKLEDLNEMMALMSSGQVDEGRMTVFFD